MRQKESEQTQPPSTDIDDSAFPNAAAAKRVMSRPPKKGRRFQRRLKSFSLFFPSIFHCCLARHRCDTTVMVRCDMLSLPLFWSCPPSFCSRLCSLSLSFSLSFFLSLSLLSLYLSLSVAGPLFTRAHDSCGVYPRRHPAMQTCRVRRVWAA